jgi:hypothetical protein
MDSQKLSLVLNGVLVLAIIVLVAFGLKEGNFDGVDKKTLEKEYISLELFTQRDDEAKRLQQEIFQKDSTLYSLNEKVKELEASNCTGANSHEQAQDFECSFEDLSQSEQARYALKTQDEQTQDTHKQTQKTKAIDSITCDSHLKGSHYIPSECKEAVETFIQNYSHATRFNVVGIVDKSDFDLTEGLRNSSQGVKAQLKVSDFQLKQFEIIAPLGLARARAKEAMQLIKGKLGKDAQVTQASYELVLDDKRGFVIQAYE